MNPLEKKQYRNLNQVNDHFIEKSVVKGELLPLFGEEMATYSPCQI